MPATIAIPAVLSRRSSALPKPSITASPAWRKTVPRRLLLDADGDADLESALNAFADNVGRGRANTLEIEAVDTGLLSYTGLDAAFDSSDIVLIAIDSETNEDTTTANNGGTAVYRFQNSNTSTVDTVLSSELELIGVFQDAALGTVDFV